MKKFKDRFRKSTAGFPQPVQSGASSPAKTASPAPSASAQSWQSVSAPSTLTTNGSSSTVQSPPPQQQSHHQNHHYALQAQPPAPFPSAAPAPSSSNSIFAPLFSDPQILIKLAQNPRTQQYLADFTFLGRLEKLRQTPELTPSEAAIDPRVQDVVNVLLGIPIIQPPPPAPTPSVAAPTAPAPAPSPSPAPAALEQLQLQTLLPQPPLPPSTSPAPSTQSLPPQALTSQPPAFGTQTPSIPSTSPAPSPAVQYQQPQTPQPAPTQTAPAAAPSQAPTSPAISLQSTAPSTQAPPPQSQQTSQTKPPESRYPPAPVQQPPPPPVQSPAPSQSTSQHYAPPTVQSPPSVGSAPSVSAPSINRDEVNRLKLQGNDAFTQRQYGNAIQLYTAALAIDPKNAVILSNRSSAFILSTPPRLKDAHDDAKAATEADPNYWKAWSRLGEARLKLDDAAGAVEAFEWAQALAGDELGEATKSSLKLARERLQASKTGQKQSPPQQPAKAQAPPPPIPRKVSQVSQNSQASSSKQTSTSIPAPNIPAPVAGPSKQPPVNSQTAPPPLPQVPTTSTSPGNVSLPPAAPSNNDPMPALTAQTNRIDISSNIDSQTSNIGTFRENPNPERGPEAAQGGREVSDSNGQTQSNEPNMLHSAGLASLAHLDNPNPTEAPPAYLPNLTSTDPTIRSISAQNVTDQLNEVTTTLAERNKGQVVIRPYVGYGPDRLSYVDAVRAVFIGMAQQDLTPYLKGEAKQVEHIAFEGMFTNTLEFPGSSYHDMDMEVSKFYEGYYPGTVGVAGYSEEYRAQQLETRVPNNLILFHNDALPPVTIHRIIQRLQDPLLTPGLFETQTVGSLYASLREIIPTPPLNATNLLLSDGFSTIGLKNQIAELCYVLNRDNPAQFRDFTKERNVFNHIFNIPAASGNSRGLGFRAFLFQMLLGYELYLRLRCETSYPPAGLITNNVAATMYLAIQFKNNVDVIHNNNMNLQEPYLVVSRVESKMREGLIRFGELIKWPYMNEVRQYMQTAYSQMGSGGTVGLDTCDWLFGLIPPGKIFRHRIMCTLVEASASIKHIKAAPHYNDGIITPNASYWPKRSPLGRVLGGIEGIGNTIGWVGPAPKPISQGGYNTLATGWYLIYSELPRIPVPCQRKQDSAADLDEQGFGRPGPDDPSATRWLTEITNIDSWVPPELPARTDLTATDVILEGIRLKEILHPTEGNITAYAALQPKWHKATLHFLVNTTEKVAYEVHTTPIFLSAHPCVGTHVLHKKQTAKYLENYVTASKLHTLTAQQCQDRTKFLFIDARGKGEEVLARAWCADKRRHAVIRRKARNNGENECCFACAAQLAGSYGGKGVGFNVLIWTS